MSFDSFGSSDSSNYDFGSDPQGAIGGSATNIQQELMQEQQRALIQQAISKITEIAWDKCVGKPDTSLSSRESNCIQNTAMTYLDTSVFILNRFSGQNSNRM